MVIDMELISKEACVNSFSAAYKQCDHRQVT